MELSCRVLESVHRRQRVVPQVDPQLGERVVTRVQVEALVGAKPLVAHSRGKTGNAYEDVRMILVRAH